MNLLREKCGVAAVFGRALDVGRLAFRSLLALQHRGQDGAGIATADGNKIVCHKDEGLVADVFPDERTLNLSGCIAIGHNRYSTSGGSGHIQPVIVGDILALAHNGNLPSVKALSDFLQSKEIVISGLNDSELMTQAIAFYLGQGQSLEEAIIKPFPLFTGAFSLVVMTKDCLAVVRDKCGIRPLVMGKLGDGFVFASETCALDAVNADFDREIKPGELVVVDEAGVRSTRIVKPNLKLDIFEFVYFSSQKSSLLGKSVKEVRYNCGINLFEEHPLKADIVVPVPETAIPVAKAYSEASRIPLVMALTKNTNLRTFIQPDQLQRESSAKVIFKVDPEVVNDKRIIIIDDSIVRGTNSKQIVQMLFAAGATEVHFLVASPPLKYPDFYGIDTPYQNELIAAFKIIEEIQDFLGTTSLYYLSFGGLIAATGLPQDVFCTSCFTGEYPIELG